MSGEVWERRADESAKAYESFVAYREMGAKRSLAKVGRKLGKNLTLIETWSARHGWVERAKAYDEMIAKTQTKDEIGAAEKTNRRHIAEAQKMQESVLRYLEDFDPKELKPSDVPQWMKAAIDIERKCMGLDQTQVSVGVQVNVDDRQVILATKLYPKAVSMLTDQQRAQLEEYRRIVEDRSPEAE